MQSTATSPGNECLCVEYDERDALVSSLHLKVKNASMHVAQHLLVKFWQQAVPGALVNEGQR